MATPRITDGRAGRPRRTTTTKRAAARRTPKDPAPSGDGRGSGSPANGDYSDRVVAVARHQEKRSEAVARAILHDITERSLKPGAMLPAEATMLQQYDVSRATLREALRILEANGLIGIKAGHTGGPVVLVPTPAEFARVTTLHFHASGFTVADVLQARVVLEPVLAGRAALCSDEAKREQLRQAVQASKDCIDQPPFRARATDFHRCLMGMANVPALELWGLALFEIVQPRVGRTYTAEERARVQAEHEALAKAILAGREARAERLMKEHIASVDYLFETDKIDRNQPLI